MGFKELDALWNNEAKKVQLIGDCGVEEYVLVLVEWRNCSYSTFTCLNNLGDLVATIENIAALDEKTAIWIEPLEGDHIDSESSPRWYPPQPPQDEVA
jgi:hypothetical protein